MPVSRKAHHTQLLATPCSRTRFVTRLGVSVLKVVATIEMPRSHQGAACPEVKNSAVLRPARRAMSSAGTKESTIEATTMSQSRVVRCMAWAGDAGWVREGVVATGCNFPPHSRPRYPPREGARARGRGTRERGPAAQGR